MKSDLKNAQKFAEFLGNTKDFVEYLADLEATNSLSELSKFLKTSGGKRYLMIKKGNAPIIDFRHFFASMSQRLNGSLINQPLMREEAVVPMLGLSLEIYQCVDEAIARKFNSCFSSEDLGSNRLGVEFAEFVLTSRAERSRDSLSSMLGTFLTRLEPVPASMVAELKQASFTDRFGEVVGQIFTSTVNFLIPKAY